MSEHAITDAAFTEIVELVAAARQRAVQAVNSQIIDLYWQVGAIISCKIAAAEWGDGVIPQLAAYLAKTQPNLRGFTARNLFRMRQFYEAYQHATGQIVPAPLTQLPAGKTPSDAPGQIVPALLTQLPSATGKGPGGVAQAGPSDAGGQIVAAVLRQLPWTHHLIILGQCKRPEEREFYLTMAIRERWSSRELERQLKGALFERSVLHPPKASQAITKNHAAALAVFKDAYLVEFLDLPAELNSGLARAVFPERTQGRLRPQTNAVGALLAAPLGAEWAGQALPLQRTNPNDLRGPRRRSRLGRGAACGAPNRQGPSRGAACGAPDRQGQGKPCPYERSSRRRSGLVRMRSRIAPTHLYLLRNSPGRDFGVVGSQLPNKQLLVAKLHEFYLQDAPAEEAP
jgi:hypothetical protein